MNAQSKPLSKLISEMAVVCSVHTSVPGLSRLDKPASLASDRAHGAREGTIKGQVNRMPGAEADIDAIKAIDRQARKLLIGYTSAWGLDRRLLPNIYIGDFSGGFEDLRRERDGLVKAFMSKASDLINAAKKHLGSYTVQPPTIEELRASFAFGFDLSPVPDVAGYTTGDKALEKAMKDRFQQDVQAAFEQAQQDLMARLADPLENLIDRMKEYDKREARKAKGQEVGKEGTFKATVVTNIVDIAKIMRSFNFTHDPRIEAIAAGLEVFEKLDHKTLTSKEYVRKAVVERAAEIRKQLGPWLS